VPSILYGGTVKCYLSPIICVVAIRGALRSVTVSHLVLSVVVCYFLLISMLCGTNIILCRYLLGLLILLDLLVSLMPTFPKDGALRLFVIYRLSLVGVFSTHRSITRLTLAELYWISDSQFKPSPFCSSVECFSD